MSWLVSAEVLVQSLAQCSVLRIWHCRSFSVGHSSGVDLIHGLETSICHGGRRGKKKGGGVSIIFLLFSPWLIGVGLHLVWGVGLPKTGLLLALQPRSPSFLLPSTSSHISVTTPNVPHLSPFQALDLLLRLLSCLPHASSIQPSQGHGLSRSSSETWWLLSLYLMVLVCCFVLICIKL